MARTNIVKANPARAGAATDLTTYTGNVDTVNFNSFVNDGNTKVLLKTGAAGDTFTFQFAGTSNHVDGVVGTPPTYVLAASKESYAGPFPVAQYGNPAQINGGAATSTVIPLG